MRGWTTRKRSSRIFDGRAGVRQDAPIAKTSI
jgi:hypothetical protein